MSDAAPPALRDGRPEEAGLGAARVARLAPAAAAFLPGEGDGDGEREPAYAGFALLVARHGVVVTHAAGGHAVRWAERDGRPVELPPAERVPVTRDTVFDLASLTKPYTALIVVRLAELGLLDLDAPVRRYLAGFPDRPACTVRSLLTHTSGLPPDLDLGPFPDNAARLAAIAGQPLAPPGTYQYSDLGMIAAGAVAETVTGGRLDELLAEHVTGPLGLADTSYRPPPELRPRIAATEHQPWTGRGVVHGSVHDEKAHQLGGVAGHAGIFATARDVAVLGQLMLGGGAYGGVRVLGEAWTRAMLTDHGAGRGLGWQLNAGQLNDEDQTGALASPTAFGHGGFTGTRLLADTRTGVLLVLLGNRVHPSRDRAASVGQRHAATRAVAGELARALGPAG